MRYERLKTEYLCFLMNRAQIDSTGHDGYLRLCTILQDTEFIPRLDMDENRCYDCRELRREFADDYSESPDILDGLYGENGTMMELLVVLAEKMNYDLADSEYEAGTGKWFREMLGNCGLISAINGCFEEDTHDETTLLVKSILDKIIFRTIDRNGEGGLFPLRFPNDDQRYTELVIQMNNYIEENYDIS